MGGKKNKNQKQKEKAKQAQELKAAEEQKKEEPQKVEQESQSVAVEEAEPQVDAVEMTPAERAQRYMDEQMIVYRKFVTEFAPDLEALQQPADFSGKLRDLTELTREKNKETARTERKELHSWEDVFANAPLKKEGMQKILNQMDKSINSVLGKAYKKCSTSLESKQKSVKETDAIKAETTKDLKTQQMLSNLCDSVLAKNHSLYLKHEETMDEERLFRKSLADECQAKMSQINENLNTQKDERVLKIEENNKLRTDINAAINGFKENEKVYQDEMKKHSEHMEQVQKQIKGTLEDRVMKSVKEVQDDKEKFEHTCNNVQSLSDQIRGFMDKFDKMKDEITDSGKKFKGYQEEIETRKIKIDLLEAQIENTHLTQAKQDKVQAEITEERSRIVKQIETLKGLKEALEFKKSAQQ